MWVIRAKENAARRLTVRLIVVEPRGIEPLSENPSSQISPSAVYLLVLPCPNADKHAFRLGSLWYITDYKATHQ